MRDPYAVLGVDRSASQKDIKGAFRRMAKKYHPDQNPDNPKAKERFSEANAAYEIIGDRNKRKQFNRGEIDSDGKERFSDFTARAEQQGMRDNPFASAFTGAQNQYDDGQGFKVNMSRSEDILKNLFGTSFGDGRGNQNANFNASAYMQNQPSKAMDIKLKTKVSVEDLARGKTQILFPNGKKISISIPPQAKNGQVIRLKGQGKKLSETIPGDALITLLIEQDGKFEADGSDIRVEVKIPLKTAIKGGGINIDAPNGRISLKVPVWTTSGKVFRLKGKGLPMKNGGMGDMLARVIIDLPEEPDKRLEDFFNK